MKAQQYSQYSDDTEWTPLHQACYEVRDSKELASAVNKLLAAGGNVNAQNKIGHVVLTFAIQRGNLESVNALLDAGGVTTVSDFQGKTPLHHASSSDVDIVKAVIGKGALVNVKDSSGETPLHVAARRNRLDIARVLLAEGAHVNAAGENHNTPLIEALVGGWENPDLVRLLIERGAKVNIATKHDGSTPLHIAVGTDKVACVKLLLEAGADVKAVTASGETAEKRAWNNPEIVKLLQAKAAELNVEQLPAQVVELQQQVKQLQQQIGQMQKQYELQKKQIDQLLQKTSKDSPRAERRSPVEDILNRKSDESFAVRATQPKTAGAALPPK